MSAARIVLEPVSASVPKARRFVADQLTDLPQDTVDVARLLVSELVTNAVLHARTELELRVDITDTAVSIQVADANPVLPVVRNHGTDAGTGRGLRVLDRMASRWGTFSVDGGKIVWFEIRTDGLEGEPDAPDPATRCQPTARADYEASGSLRDPRLSRVPGESNAPIEKPDDIVNFRWLGLPLSQLDQTAEHYDAVLREFHLVLEREPEARATVPGRLIALMDELTQFGPLISSVEHDLAKGRSSGAETLDVGLELHARDRSFCSPPRQHAGRDRRVLQCGSGAALTRTGERRGGPPQMAHR